MLNIEKPELPTYLSPIFNLANQFSRATRPEVVGQMTELFQEYLRETPKEKISVETWREWYINRYGHNLKKAKQRLKKMIENFKEILNSMTDEHIEKWIEDLVIYKTFAGLYIQKPILEKLKEVLKCQDYRFSTPEEESKGIDAFLICNNKEIPLQIKAYTYKEKGKILEEKISVPIVFYEKTKDGLKVEYSQLLQFLQNLKND